MNDAASLLRHRFLGLRCDVSERHRARGDFVAAENCDEPALR